MLTHILFYIIYLIGISWIADRYHKNLRRISDLKTVLKFPKTKKDLVLADLDKAKIKLKKDQRLSYIVLTVIFILHQGYAAIISIFFYPYNYDLSSFQLAYPIIALVISMIITTVIFWLKGKGGGIPQNRNMDRFGGPDPF